MAVAESTGTQSPGLASLSAEDVSLLLLSLSSQAKKNVAVKKAIINRFINS
jgi:hypothetical protein